MITVKGIPVSLQVAGALGDRIASGGFRAGGAAADPGELRRALPRVRDRGALRMRAFERQGLVRRDAHRTALCVAEEDPGAEQGALAQVLQRLDAVEAQLGQLPTAPASTARADGGAGSGQGTWRRSGLRGVSVPVLGGAGNVLARVRLFSGRGLGHAG